MRKSSLSSVFCLLSCLSLFTARGGEPGFAFSGRLLETSDSTSAVVKLDGKTSYAADLYLRLYDDSEGEKTEKSEALWGRCVRVNVQDGNFSCDLCDSAGTPIAGLPCERLADAFARLSGTKLSVGVTPFDDANTEITPRQTLTSAPFAVCAHDALGSAGDLAVPGTVNATGFSAESAAFAGTVNHEGTVTLASRLTLPKLVMDDTRTLTLSTLDAASAGVTNATASDVAVGTAKAAVGDVGELVAADLAFAGNTRIGMLSPPEGSDELVVDGAVGTKAIEVTDIEVGSPLALFKWEPAFYTLKAASTSSESSGYYNYEGQNGWWSAPTDKPVFVSLSFNVSDSSGITVKVDEIEIANLSLSGGVAPAWMSVQVFLNKKQKISWSGAKHPDGVLMTCREFSY